MIVSCERLSGSPFSGSWANQGATYVENIGRMFPEAKCIIGFRKHDALVRSLYKQYLHEGSTASPDELFHPDGSGKIGFEDLQFRRRIEQCDQHFADVFVYTQEELRDNLGGFLKDLSQFLGTPPPRSQRNQPDKAQRRSANTRASSTASHFEPCERGAEKSPTRAHPQQPPVSPLQHCATCSVPESPCKLRRHPIHPARSDGIISPHRVCG